MQLCSQMFLFSVIPDESKHMHDFLLFCVFFGESYQCACDDIVTYNHLDFNSPLGFLHIYKNVCMFKKHYLGFLRYCSILENK